MLKTFSDCVVAVFRYRKTNVSILLFLTYLLVAFLYLSDQLSFDGTLPVDLESYILLDHSWRDLQNITFAQHPYTSRDNDRVHDYLRWRVEQLTSGIPYAEVSDDYETKRSSIFRQRDVFNASSTLSRVIYFESSNVLVRLEGKNSELGDALLLSAHYDSVPAAYGATDDGKGIASMLALLEHYCQHQPDRTLIFNFNNNEEFGLLGATLFFDHPWSSEVKYVINLEGTGTGEGKSVLFRTTNAQTAKIYENAVSVNPFGNSVFQQGFYQRFIHSETDYKVYEANGLLGWDIAFYRPRALYHTASDDIRHTSKQALWNMLSTTWQLCDYVANNDVKNVASKDSPNLPAVYFDIFGFKFISVSARSLFICNCILGTVFPALYILLRIIAVKRGTWKNGTLVPAILFPISFIFSAIVVRYTEAIIMVFNPYLVSRDYFSLIVTLCVEFILLNALITTLPGKMLTISSMKDTIFVQLAAGSWFCLIYCTYLLHSSKYTMTGVYPVSMLYIGLSLAVLVKAIAVACSENVRRKSPDSLDPGAPEQATVGHYGSISSVNAANDVVGDENHTTEETHRETDVDERAPLISSPSDPSSAVAPVPVPVSRNDSPSAHLQKTTVNDEERDYIWLLQFVVLVPAFVVLFQMSLDVLSAINQTVQESAKSYTDVYRIVFVLSLALSVLALPFICQLRFVLCVALFITWLVTSLRCLSISGFTEDKPMKVRFIQNINGTVELTGKVPYLIEMITGLPSFELLSDSSKESGIQDRIVCDDSGDIGVCSYEAIAPNPIDWHSHVPVEPMSVEVIRDNRNSVNRSEYAPISAELKINVLENRACTIYFNSSTELGDNSSSVRKITIYHDVDSTLHGKPNDIFRLPSGIDELQLHKLNFESNAYHIGLEWFPRILIDKIDSELAADEESVDQDKLGLRIRCYWGEYDSESLVNGQRLRKVPAYDELMKYSPLSFSFTNRDKGLVFEEKYLEL